MTREVTTEDAIIMLETIRLNKDAEFEDLRNWYHGIDKDYNKAINMAMTALEQIGKISDLLEGTIDHFDKDDAMDLLYEIKKVIK